MLSTLHGPSCCAACQQVLWELASWALPYEGESIWTISKFVRTGGRPRFPPPGAVPGPQPEAYEQLREGYEALAG